MLKINFRHSFTHKLNYCSFSYLFPFYIFCITQISFQVNLPFFFFLVRIFFLQVSELFSKPSCKQNSIDYICLPQVGLPSSARSQVNLIEGNLFLDCKLHWVQSKCLERVLSYDLGLPFTAIKIVNFCHQQTNVKQYVVSISRCFSYHRKGEKLKVEGKVTKQEQSKKKHRVETGENYCCHSESVVL